MSLAEVAKATFYRHFESKDALVLAYLEYRDQALWDYLSQPTPAKDLREALTKFEQYVNWPEVIGCPFLRIASEFPDTAHPFHRLAIEHQNKILEYLTDLLKPFAIDEGRRPRRYLVSSMAPSPLECSMGRRGRLRFSRPPRRCSRTFRARELNAADEWRVIVEASLTAIQTRDWRRTSQRPSRLSGDSTSCMHPHKEKLND